MVKYFEELESPNSHFITLTTRRNKKIRIVNEQIPQECLDEISKLYKKIDEYDLFCDKGLPKKPYFTEGNYDFSECYSCYANYHNAGQSGLTTYGVAMIDRLKEKFKKNYNGEHFDEEFYAYFEIIFDYISHPISKNKTELIEHLRELEKIVNFQNKLTKEDKIMFNSLIKKLESTDIIKNQNEYISEEYALPNAWYITPFNHLYNTMGPNGHKGANLIYPYSNIQYGLELINEKYYLEKIDTILKTNRINRQDYMEYVHLIHDFISILPSENDILGEPQYSYDPKMNQLVIGILSAYAGLYRFFNNLYKYSKDYKADIEYLKQFSLDELLIRCCGFHKVLSVDVKTITTSCLNYEEEFKEYIDKGWSIDFVKPITLNYFNRLEEIEEDFMKIKKLHDV